MTKKRRVFYFIKNHYLTDLIEFNDSLSRRVCIFRFEAVVFQVVKVLLDLMQPVVELVQLTTVVVDSLQGVGDRVPAHEQLIAEFVETRA